MSLPMIDYRFLYVNQQIVLNFREAMICNKAFHIQGKLGDVHVTANCVD